MINNEITNVRNEVNSHLGSEVYIRAHKGRKRVSVKKGVIDSTYPSVFVLKLLGKKEDSCRRVSYSYTDLITKNVELSLCE